MRGPRRYTDLKNGLPGMASNLLAERLSKMESGGLLRREHHTEPSPRDLYVLTERGRELRPVLLALVVPEELPANAFAIDFDLDEASYAMTIEAQAPPGRRYDATDRIRVDEGGAADARVRTGDQPTGSTGLIASNSNMSSCSRHQSTGTMFFPGTATRAISMSSTRS